MHKQQFIVSLLSVLLIFQTGSLHAQPAAVSSIKPDDLVEYDGMSPEVKKVVENSLRLTRMDLAYTFGSDSPEKGGMDCSGTVSHVLKTLNLKGVPRTSYTIYHWADKHGELTKLKDIYSQEHSVFGKLKPGDLVFWEGTYAVKDRSPPISHVMLYLGTLKKDGKGVLFGASSGRRYRGKKIHGVSVFDFRVPSKTSKARMVAFGPIPGLKTTSSPKPEPAKKGKTTSKSTEKPKKTANSDKKDPIKETSSQSNASNSTNVVKSLSDKFKEMKGTNQPFKKLFSNKDGSGLFKSKEN
ncbi:MAG: NlpC/P60 family protein [Verrucomicrobiales bacterium]|nr:NlpC/P60 family protein [Verrucomicrobiales bacterium]